MLRLLSVVLPAVLLVPSAAAQPAGLDRVVRVTVSTVRQMQTVLALSGEVWSCHGAGVGTFDVQMSPEQLAALQQTGIPHSIYIEDVQRLLDETWAANQARLAQAGDGPEWYEAFHPLDEINARLDQLAAAHPALASVSTVGTSVEGRPIRGIRITGPGPSTGRPGVVINGCQHAREWISPAVTIYEAEQLLELYDTDCRVKAIVDSTEFIIVPVSNPDGYFYTWINPTNNTWRLWRKNRRPPPTGSQCYGVDLNRNWSVGWGNNNGSSPLPCEETYRGTAAFSEPETQAISGLADQFGPRLALHLDMHSYGPQFLSPWGYTEDPPPDLARMDALGAMWTSEVESLRGTEYEYGQGSIILYISSGASRDYSYGTHGAMSWTIELTHAGGGFVAPPEEILPAARENFLGLQRLVEATCSAVLITHTPPTVVSPGSGASVQAVIENVNGVLAPGTAQLFSRVGSTGAFSASSLSPAGGNQYSGTLPAAPCGQVVQYYFRAQATDGRIVLFPACGAATPLEVAVYSSGTVLSEDFEAANPGWTVQDTALTSGTWQRVTPNGTSNGGTPAAPGQDTTPTGTMCFVTQNGAAGGAAGAADVDGGPTRLTSPAIDLSGAARAVVAYNRWAYSANGVRDAFSVEVSNDNGQAWTPVSSVIGGGGWVAESFRVEDYVAPSAQVRLRFTATDNPNDSLTEGGLDDVSVSKLFCTATCYPDCNADGALNLGDFGCFQTKFALQDPYADCNGDGVLNLGDFGCFQTKFALGCP